MRISKYPEFKFVSIDMKEEIEFYLLRLSKKKFRLSFLNINFFLENSEEAEKKLYSWAEDKNTEFLINSDYNAAFEAVEILLRICMLGIVLYTDDEPVAWILAECILDAKTVMILFVKANPEYKDVGQYIINIFARYLPECIKFINIKYNLNNEIFGYNKKNCFPVKFIKSYKILMHA